MSVLIGRPINGIPINGLEYVCDDEGYEIVFQSIDAAHSFLIAHGITDEDIENNGIEFVDAGDED